MSLTVESQSRTLTDTLNRPMDDLRISVIDRCNFRCPYCMPEHEYSKHYQFLKEQQWLNFNEITRLTRLFVKLGVTKVRITGGEPLLRPNVHNLIQKLTVIEGITDLALTTNGALLSEQAGLLRDAGLHRLTVSLDALENTIYRQLNGEKSDVNKTLEGIQAAEKAGFGSIKINVVVQKSINDSEIMNLVEYFRGTPHVLRFIEYMDVGNCNHWESKKVVTSSEILNTIGQKYPLKPLSKQYRGEVASRYGYVDGKGELGFISSISQPFCQSCTRARLSTDGKIYTCLFSDKGIDVRTVLRQNLNDEDLKFYIHQIWSRRDDRYSELRSELLAKHQTRHKVEMFQIGG